MSGVLPMDIPDPLVREIKAGNVVLFVGPGLSRGAGLPSWTELIRPLAQEIDVPADTDPLKIAQYYELERGRHALIQYVLDATDASNRQPTDTHFCLAQLPVQTWLTTNYDDLIERAFSKRKTRYRKVVQDQDLPYLSSDETSLVKMHGDREQPNSIIITEQDYFTYFKRFPLVQIKLANLLAEKSFLFVGYDSTDPDFRQIYSEIAFELRQHQRMSYALMFDVDKFTVNELRARHIQVINIPIGPGESRTAQLQEVLERLRRRVVDETTGSRAEQTSGNLLQGRYRRGEVLVSTGLSTVYKAHDVSTDTPCVIKDVDLQLSPDALDVMSFRLKHPLIAEVLSFWREDDTAYVVQRYYDGWTMADLIKANPDGLGQGWVELWAGQLMHALDYMHGRTPPLVHRDLRPPNILVRRSNKSIVLLDWSSALLYTPDAIQTSIGTMEGYTAPEQLHGAAELRSDLYSLGAVLYCLLCGKPPPNAVARAHGTRLYSEPLGAVFVGSYIKRMLALEPSDRFESVAAMLDEWEEDQQKTRLLPDMDVFFKGVFPPADDPG